MVITSAVGKQLSDKDKSGFRIVKVLNEEITHEYFGFKEMPEKVEMEDCKTHAKI